ncbi:MAG: metal ABC transporter substrate-binding protein [Deltaproteobacteria bacterium]|jgi:ABC-type Zn uptake system ZnuABC Zn-binding protein ZnuA|nr:metal ABC transporter substrate-binding protein [Deltaproteobacteria bacterium]
MKSSERRRQTAARPAPPRRPATVRTALSAALTIALLAALLACGLRPVQLQAASGRVACASYPVWLFARFLSEGRDRFALELLTNPAAGCPHEFAPTPRDLERLTQTGVVIKNGLNLERYLDKALRVAPPDVRVVDASRGIPTLSLTWGRLDLGGDQVPGPDGRLPSLTPNPHIFLSPRLAKTMAANIAAALTELDPEGAEHYAARLELWNADMEELEAAAAAFKAARRGRKVVTSHGFMDYLAHDLGLTVLADLSPSEESPPSAARLAALSQLIAGQGVSAVLIDPEADPATARALSRETGVPAAVLDTAAAGPADPPADFFQLVIKEDLQLLARLIPPDPVPPAAQ